VNVGIRESDAVSRQEQGSKSTITADRSTADQRRIHDSVNTASLGIVIQAKKAGILRDIITADRAFSILITGQTNDFSIHLGIGKWIQNLAVAAAEVILLSWLFLAVDVPEMLWTQHVEKRSPRK
jgi:di/tricarboxylate transporter